MGLLGARFGCSGSSGDWIPKFGFDWGLIRDGGLDFECMHDGVAWGMSVLEFGFGEGFRRHD